MKNLLKLSFIAIATALLFASCEGPEGPAGADASAECMTCHNAGTEFSAKLVHFEESAHSLGTYYTRGGQCAACHSTEGFLARKDYTSISQIDDFSYDGDQTPISCRTCHAVHNAYDETDWALTFADQVTETIFGYQDGDTYTSISFPDKGNGNMCLQCHQARDRGNVPAADATADVTTGSTHWGPHYGVQGNVLFASGGVNLAGAESYPSSSFGHAALDKACISCHMVDGDHTLGVDYSACSSCHGAENMSTAVKNLHTEIDGLKFELGAALAAAGYASVQTESEWVWNDVDQIHEEIIDTVGFGPKNTTMPAAYAKALYNYMVVYQDHSYGTHNPSYIRALLNNSLDAISAK